MKDRDLYSIEEARDGWVGFRATLCQMLRRRACECDPGCRPSLLPLRSRVDRASTTTNSPAMDSTRGRQAAQDFFPFPKARRRTGGNWLATHRTNGVRAYGSEYRE